MRSRVTYLSNDNKVISKVIACDASSTAAIAESLGVDETQIIEIRAAGKNKQSSFAILKQLSAKIALDDQAVILTALASAAHSGQNTLIVLEKLLQRQRINYSFQSTDDTLAKRLTKLKFHPLAILVIESGISSGKLKESLATAAEELNRMLAQSSALGAKSRTGIVYHIIGLGLWFLVPMMANKIIAPMVETGSIELDEIGSFVANVYLFNQSIGFWLIPSLLILAAVFIKDLAFLLRKLPVFGLAWQWLNAARAIQFNIAVDILLSAGYPSRVVPEKMLLICSNKDKQIYRQMAENISNGFMLSELIASDYFPPIYALAISNFENVVKESQAKIIDNASAMLIRNDDSISGKIATILSVTGLMSAALGILMLAGGIMLPMMSINI